MSLMSHAIRPKPEVEMEEKNNPFDPRTIETKMSDYKKAFFTQRALQEKEIECFFPVEGHRVLLKAVILPEKTEGGIYLSEVAREAVSYDIGLVIGLGPECYMDKERFPFGPRCKIGDWVDFTPFEKQPKNYNGYRCYVIDDDRVNYPVIDLKAAVRELRTYSRKT